MSDAVVSSVISCVLVVMLMVGKSIAYRYRSRGARFPRESIRILGIEPRKSEHGRVGTFVLCTVLYNATPNATHTTTNF